MYTSKLMLVAGLWHMIPASIVTQKHLIRLDFSMKTEN